MSITSSLSLGVQGLATNARRLSGISDNIANTATLGYKRVETTFSSFVLNDNPARFAPGGVTARTVREVDTRGALQASDSATDLAVNGRGFLPVVRSVGGLANPDASPAGQGDFLLTTTGSFNADAAGFLRSAEGDYLLGWPADGPENVPRESITALRAVRADGMALSAAATTEINLRSNLPANDTLDSGLAEAASYVQSVEVFDALGGSQRLDFSFTAVPQVGAPSNTWNLSIADTEANVIAEAELLFNGAGANAGSIASITPAAPATVNADTGDFAFDGPYGPLSVNLGTSGALTGMTQFAAPFEPQAPGRDGNAAGRISRVEIGVDGIMRGTYDNGQIRDLYRIPLANVANAQGLRAVDGQAFAVTQESGEFFLWDAGTGPVGGVQGFALEGSTADVAEELTQLIETQRAYSANAKIIQTVDDMLAETTNLKR